LPLIKFYQPSGTVFHNFPLKKNYFEEVRMEGLEPPHLAASDPKSDVSTNFTTCAFGAAKVMDLG